MIQLNYTNTNPIISEQVRSPRNSKRQIKLSGHHGVADQPSRRNVGRTNTRTQKEKDDFHILDGGERDSIGDFGVKNNAGFTGYNGEYENFKVQGANESSRSSANQSPRQRPRQISIGRSEERGGGGEGRGGGDDGGKCRDSPIPQYGINENDNGNGNGNSKSRNINRNISNYNGTTGTGDTVNRQTDGRHHTRNLPLITSTSTVNSDADLELSLGIYSENHDNNYMNNIEKNKEFEREYEMDKVDNKERDKERSRIKERNRIKNEDKNRENFYDYNNNIMNNNNNNIINNNNYDKKNINNSNNDNSYNNDYDNNNKNNNNNKDNNKYKDKGYGEILLNKNKVDARKLYEKRISREERSKIHRSPNNVIRSVVDDSEGEFKNGEIGGIRYNGNNGNDGNNGKCSRVNGLRDNCNNDGIDHYDNYHVSNSSINGHNDTNNTNNSGTYSPNNNNNNNHQISTNIDKNKPIIRVNRRFKKAPPLPQDDHSEASHSEISDTGGDEDKSINSKTRIQVRNVSILY